MRNIFFVLLITLGYFGHAQEFVPIIKPEVNPDYVMFKKTVTRRMDLNEKQNKPFYSRNAEISSIIIKAVLDGILTPYTSDSTNTPMDMASFNEKISVEQQSSGFDSGFDSGFGASTQTSESDTPKRNVIPSSLFSILYIKEDVIFDRNRSRMYFYIRSISVALPASVGPDFNPAGFEKVDIHFKYEDLVKLFRGPVASIAKWYNDANQASHLNFSDAFELRMFSAPIIKISNNQDVDIRQQYGDLIAKDPLNALVIQQKYEYDLVEFENELWEY